MAGSGAPGHPARHTRLQFPAGKRRIAVLPARGKPATPTYKVSIAYQQGYAASGTLVLFGTGARAKARNERREASRLASDQAEPPDAEPGEVPGEPAG